MDTASAELRRDFKALLDDHGKISRQIDKARGDPRELCQVLCENLSPPSLRLLTFCLDDDNRKQAKALLLDDLDTKTARRFCVVERLVEYINDAEIGPAIRLYRRVKARGSPEDPSSEVKPAEEMSIEPYIVGTTGVVMGYLRISDGTDCVYECREPMAQLTETAAMILTRVAHGYKMLQDNGVSAFPSEAVEAQRDALVVVMLRVKLCCDVLGVDWKKLVKDSE